jgi:hypothetical protein
MERLAPAEHQRAGTIAAGLGWAREPAAPMHHGLSVHAIGTGRMFAESGYRFSLGPHPIRLSLMPE